MQTRKHPRTLNEAFGPYTDNRISEPKETGYGWIWWAFMVAIAIVSVAIIVVTA